MARYKNIGFEEFQSELSVSDCVCDSVGLWSKLRDTFYFDFDLHDTACLSFLLL